MTPYGAVPGLSTESLSITFNAATMCSAVAYFVEPVDLQADLQ